MIKYSHTYLSGKIIHQINIVFKKNKIQLLPTYFGLFVNLF